MSLEYISSKNRKKLQTKNPPRARSDYSMIAFETNLFIFGGSDGSKILKDLVQFNLSQHLFKKNNINSHFFIENREFISNYFDESPSERLGHTSIRYHNCMYLFGGWDGVKTLNDFWEYDFFTQKHIFLKIL